MRLLKFLLPLLALQLAGGCAAAPKMTADPQAPYPPSRPPVVGDILHIPTGYYVSEAQMMTALADARIVYVGETHDNPASHRLELAVLKAMDERYPGRMALGMEMFTPAQQKTLDRWVAGELSEKEFLKQSHWYDQWRMDFEYYQALLDFARERRIPVIGLNAEKSLVKTLARKDVSELSEEERRQVPQMDMTDRYHREMVKSIYGGHEKGNSHLEGFLRVQTLWDETMAENIARLMESPEGENRRMVVVAGGNHVRHGFGIPRRVFRRLPVSYAMIGSKELVIPKEKRDQLMDVEAPELPMTPYDYLIFTEYEDLPKQGVKLGVLLDDEGGKVKVKAVQPGSAAEAVGVREGDRLLEFDGIPLAESFDLVYEVKRKRPGDRAVLEIERNGEKQKVEVFFFPEAASPLHPPAK